jgi:hypothetical protein
MERRQMKRAILVIQLLLLNSLVFSHDEFFLGQGGLLVRTHYPSETNDKSQLLKWPVSIRSAIPINVHFEAGYALPGTLSQSQTSADFLAARNAWHNSVPSVGFLETSNWPSISIHFSSYAAQFGGSVKARSAAAITGVSASNNEIVVDGGTQTQFGQSVILFNNTAEFTGGFDGFRWINSNNIPNDGWNYIHFKSTAIHELGHLLGLAHCRDPYYDPSTLNVMYDTLLPRQVRTVLQTADQTGLSTLYSLSTGVEDYIYFFPPGPTYFTQNSSVSYSATFVDEFPYGDFILGNYSWSLLVQHGEGEYVAATGTTSTAQSWQFTMGALPNGYFWLRDGSGNVKGRIKVTGTDNDGIPHTSYYNISVGGVPYNTTSGTLTHNETWGGEQNVTGSIIVPAGITLKILPGTNVRFASNTSLTVNGVLTAGSSPLSAITFTALSGTIPGSWGSIVLDGSGASGSSLNGVNIQYGTQVSVINASNVTIQNGTISDVYYGIQYSGSTGSVIGNTVTSSTPYHGIRFENGSTVTCNQNKVKKTGGRSGVGIYYGGGSSGYVGQNDITGWSWGIGATWGSSPQFYNSSLNGRNNRVTDCDYGVMVYYQSYPIIGYPVSAFYGNSIYNNTKNIELNTWYYTTSTLSAAQVWWGGTPNSSMFDLGNGSSLQFVWTYLSTDPWLSIPLPVIAGGGGTNEGVAAAKEQNIRPVQTNSSGLEAVSGTNPSMPTISPLFDGIQLRWAKKYNEAKDFFKSYVSKYPDDQAAYVELYNCYSNETSNDLVTFFSSLPKKAAKEHALLLPYLYLKQGKIAEAKDINEKIAKQYANSDLGIRAKLNNFYITLYDEKKPAEASLLLNEVSQRTQLSTSLEFSLAQQALATYPKSEGPQLFPNEVSASAKVVPEEFSLSQNYPNPFNPTTTLAFDLPEPSQVVLTVSDNLGRQVATVVNGYRSAGHFEVKFDASKLGSGVYFYKLQAGRYTAVKKMLLIK